MIRPRPARWFEILCARGDATIALAALASTGAVELEARSVKGLPEEFGEIVPLLASFVELQMRYQAYWPTSRARGSPFPERPAIALARSLATIRAWAGDAERLIIRSQRIEAERAELALWRRVVESLHGDFDFGALREPALALERRLFVFPADSRPHVGDRVVARRFEGDGVVCVLAVGARDDLVEVAQQCAAAKGRAYDVPVWLAGDGEHTKRVIDSRSTELAVEQGEIASTLAALHERHRLQTALADAHRLQWVIRNVRALEADEIFCWITGWTSDFGGESLATALDESGARALLRFASPPHEIRAPLLLANPWWARPFEIFSRALGMPAHNEADPSIVLAIAVPLMFGYMFGDVGQGALLALGGLVLSRRFAIARLFVAGGVSAMAFGTLFGSVFGLHGVIAPLWIDPLDAPLRILLVPLAGGAMLLVVGLALGALEAFWRREFVRWLASDAAVAVAYVALIAGLLEADAFAIAAIAALWFCAGHAALARRASESLVAAGELAERLFQLGVNSLSFARVGAFALAHAGLSSAIVALMRASDDPALRLLVLVAGNAIVIALEALVVSIQTTRLVLFEFFTRFLVAEGRLFRPLAPPPFAQET